MFSWGIKRDQWHEMGEWFCFLLNIEYLDLICRHFI